MTSRPASTPTCVAGFRPVLTGNVQVPQSADSHRHRDRRRRDRRERADAPISHRLIPRARAMASERSSPRATGAGPASGAGGSRPVRMPRDAESGAATAAAPWQPGRSCLRGARDGFRACLDYRSGSGSVRGSHPSASPRRGCTPPPPLLRPSLLRPRLVNRCRPVVRTARRCRTGWALSLRRRPQRRRQRRRVETCS